MGDYVNTLALMMQDEASVRQAIYLTQQHCLSGGLTVTFQNNAQPTPHFENHIQRYFVPFCRDAIQSFLAVGFAPYRLRTLRDGCKVPEILPIGTYSWNVSRAPTTLPKAWYFDRSKHHMGVADNATGKKDETALLCYEVTSGYTDAPPSVYAFTQPSTFFQCTSALSTLVQPYRMLCHKRECTLRADQFNSKPAVVFEEQLKTARANEAASSGSFITEEFIEENKDRRARMDTRQTLHHDVFDRARIRSQLPDETVTLVAPINHSVHSLDKALTPMDVHREELGFMRLVAVATGLPPSLLLQGSAVIGTSAVSTSASSMAWADSAESCNRMIMETCNHINAHLGMLLEDVYCAIYKDASKKMPRFLLRALPTLCLEQLSSVFNSELIDDAVFSSILKVCFIGCLWLPLPPLLHWLCRLCFIGSAASASLAASAASGPRLWLPLAASA